MKFYGISIKTKVDKETKIEKLKIDIRKKEDKENKENLEEKIVTKIQKIKKVDTKVSVKDNGANNEDTNKMDEEKNIKDNNKTTKEAKDNELRKLTIEEKSEIQKFLIEEYGVDKLCLKIN